MKRRQKAEGGKQKAESRRRKAEGGKRKGHFPFVICHLSFVIYLSSVIPMCPTNRRKPKSPFDSASPMRLISVPKTNDKMTNDK
jgi:hypothetical protein